MEAEWQPVIERLSDTCKNPRDPLKSHLSHNGQNNRDNGRNIFINAPPKGCEKEYNGLFTAGAVEFLVDLALRFDEEIEDLYDRRLRRKLELGRSPKIPKFSKSTASLDGTWKVSPVAKRLENSHLHLGDVSPSDLSHFVAALKSPVQGIQVDFDDGHCPTWRNQILGLHNVGLAVGGLLPGVPKLAEAPILMLRPRAWNMIERNVSINGRLVPGPIFDFGLLIYHNGGRILKETGIGASFYLSKLEGAEEAELWREIFVWGERRLKFPRGTIKACVLIENILSAFVMDDILWELREHALGLNCGVWDYAASIISKFGTSDERFLLPDRNKYVNAEQTFLSNYMRLVVETCHKRGTRATGGMAANLLPLDGKNPADFEKVVRTVCKAKLREVKMGLDGFMIYDLRLVRSMNELWREHGADASSRIDSFAKSKSPISEQDLLSLPKGGVTAAGLEHNIRIGILFVLNWLNGKGHFACNGCIEDSATAEISRSQVWQWIRYGAKLEDIGGRVTRKLVSDEAQRIVCELQNQCGRSGDGNRELLTALALFLDLVNRRTFPEFITTYLNEERTCGTLHSNL